MVLLQDATTTATTMTQSTTRTTTVWLSSSSSLLWLLLFSTCCWRQAEGFVSVSSSRVAPPAMGALFYSDSSLPVPPPRVDLLTTDNNKNKNTQMRTKHELATTTTTTTFRGGAEKQAVSTITSMEEFQKQVLWQQESIVVVRFLASWCPGCKATSPAYQRLKHKLQNASPSISIRFVDCPLDGASVPFHEELGVTAIPFVQVYHPTEGLVDQQQITRSNMAEFQKRLVSSLAHPHQTTTDS